MVAWQAKAEVDLRKEEEKQSLAPIRRAARPGHGGPPPSRLPQNNSSPGGFHRQHNPPALGLASHSSTRGATRGGL